MAVTTSPTTPLSTAVRRSARLGSHCIEDSRKRTRVSDSESQSFNVPLSPEPTPRWIRAQKRQKILDGLVAAPRIDMGKTRAGKRKALIPDDQEHIYESESHHRVVKKRKENIVNDALAATPSTSSLKISVNLNTRQAAGNNVCPLSIPILYLMLIALRIGNEKNLDQSQSLRYTRNTRSSALKSTLSVDSKSKSRLTPKSRSRSKSQSKSLTRLDRLVLPSCSSSPSSPRMMTRTMKKLNGSAPASAHASTTQSHVLAPTLSSLSSMPRDTSQSSDVTSNFTNDIQPSTTSTTTRLPNPTSNNDVPPASHANDAPSSTSVPQATPLSISAPLSLPMSFMNVSLSSPTPLPMPLNPSFLNMMSLSMPLNMPILTDMPSESELGFGFQPQEGFSSTEREEGKEGHIFMNGEQSLSSLQHSASPLLTPAGPITSSALNETTTTTSLSLSSHTLDRPSLPLHPPLLLPPKSCTPGLNPISTRPTIPPRLVISTCASLQSQPPPASISSTSPTSPTFAHTSSTYSAFSPYISPTSPTYSSPLKAVCFPPGPTLHAESFLSPSQGQQPPLPSASHQLPTLSPSTAMKEWDAIAMDMAEDQRQAQEAMQQEMDIGYSTSVLSFGNSSPGQGDDSSLPQHQEQQEQDRSPLLEPAPQPPSLPQYPQLALSPPPSLPSYSPSPPPCSSSSSCASSSSSSREYHKRIEYSNHQMPEWTPRLDKERNLWRLACKIRVWEITKRYTPDTIRTVVAQEAHDYYSVHGFPLGYGSVPVRGRKRRCRKMGAGAGSALASGASDSTSCSSTMIVTPPLSPTMRHRDDEFMSEETYPFELLDDDDDVDGGGDLRSMEDEWRYEGFEDDDEFEDDDDSYEEEDEDEDDEFEEVEEDQIKISANGMKKAGEDQDQDPDAEGEMEIDIEPFQDPSFNAELSSPTSPTGSSTSSKSKSRSKSNAALGDEQQSFLSSFYVPPVPPHVQMHMMQMQMQQRQEEQRLEEEAQAPDLTPSLDSSPLLSSSLDGTPTSSSHTVDHTSTANIHTPPMEIHLPPASQHYHHQLIQLSSNILPLPPPRLDSVRVSILRQSEMGGLKTTGRGTPADRKRGAIWGWSGIGGGRVEKCGSKRGLDESGSESESEEEGEGRKRGRPRLRLMLSDHDIEPEPRRGYGRHGAGENGAETAMRLSLPGDGNEGDVRMSDGPTGFKCDMSESNDKDEDIPSRPMHKLSSSSASSSFMATDQGWDAFLASLDDKQPQPQGEEGTIDSCVSAADSDTTTHGQLLLDLDLTNRPRQHPPLMESERPLSPSPSSGMFMFDEGCDGSSTWFGSGGDGVSEGRSGGAGMVVGLGLVGSGGTCPSDALALDGFSFPPSDGSSTLSYALG